MVRTKLRRIKKVSSNTSSPTATKRTKKVDDYSEDSDEHSSDSDYSDCNHLPHAQNSEELQEQRIIKLLKDEGCYRYLRRNMGGYQRSVDYCKQVLKHTSKLLLYVGGDDFANFAIIRACLIIELMKLIMKSLHSTIISRYCNHLSDLGFKPSKN
jgi:hypothetical protein